MRMNMIQYAAHSLVAALCAGAVTFVSAAYSFGLKGQKPLQQTEAVWRPAQAFQNPQGHAGIEAEQLCRGLLVCPL